MQCRENRQNNCRRFNLRLLYQTIFLALIFIYSTGCTNKANQSGLNKEIENQELVEKDAEPNEQDAIKEKIIADQVAEVKLSEMEKKLLEKKENDYFSLDKRETETVRKYFSYFTHDPEGRKIFEKWLKRSEGYVPYIRKVFEARGLPEDLIYLPFVESGFNIRAGSRAGAKGLWQFMPATGRRYSLEVGWWVDERYDPYKSTHAASQYLQKLYGLFGDWHLALAAYNAGEGRVGKAIKEAGTNDFFQLAEMKKNKKNRWGHKHYYLPKETRHYVPQLIAVVKIINNLEKLGFEKPDWTKEPNIVQVPIKPKTDLKSLAKAVGMPWKYFKQYNSAYREEGSRPDRSGFVYVPAKKRKKALAYLSSDKVKQYKNYYSFYKIRHGDSWYKIAYKYSVPVPVLKKYNKTRSDFLRPGKTIKIPGEGTKRMVAATLKKNNSFQKATRKKNTYNAKTNYTIKRGDSLWTISQKNNMTIEKLANANGLSKKKALQPGQKIYIPQKKQNKNYTTTNWSVSNNKGKKQYTVKDGDSLWSIARAHDTGIKKIAAANNIDPRAAIRAGQLLYLPDNKKQNTQNITQIIKTSVSAWSVSGAKNQTNEQRTQQPLNTKTNTKNNRPVMGPMKIKTYKVKPGDSLYTIARRFKTSTDSIMSWNNMDSARIYPGDKIKLLVY